jgi:hypothetical protein
VAEGGHLQAVALKGERGKPQLCTFLTAMSHEIVDNDHKGHWLQDETTGEPRQDLDLMGDLLYHAAKLGLAVASGNKTAILEYAADVGNCAWFVADKHQALDLDLLHPGPIEYDEEQEPVATPETLAAMRRAAYDFAESVAKAAMTAPTQQDDSVIAAPPAFEDDPRFTEQPGDKRIAPAGPPPPPAPGINRVAQPPAPDGRYYPQDTEATMRTLHERRDKDFDF